MTLHGYLAFLTVAVVVALVPGPDFAVVSANTLAGGRLRGWATALGVAGACAVQGVAAAAGLGAFVLRSQPVFLTIKWAGVAYLAYLAALSLRSSWRGTYRPMVAGRAEADPARGLRQGFLSNITNPKVLVFYLAILPQFIGPGSGGLALAGLALTHAAIALLWLGLLVTLMHRASGWLARRRVRRWLDAITGTVLGGFSVALAVEKS